MQNLKSKGLKAFAWDLFSVFSSQGMSFIVTIFLARLLEPSDFGLIAIVMVVVGIAQIFTDAGLGSALIQRRKILSIHFTTVFYFNIFIASVLASITFFSAEYIANFYESKNIATLLQVSSTLFLINAVTSVQSTRLKKQLNFSLLAKVEFTSSVLSGVIAITLAFSGYGIWSLLTFIISRSLLYCILLWLVSTWRPSLNFSLKALNQLWSFGFRIFLSDLLNAIFSRLDFLIIGKVFAVDTLGYFQRATQLNTIIITYTSGSLMAVMYPIFSQIQNDLLRMRLVVLRSINILCLVVFLLLGGLYIVTEELILIIFSEKWLPSVPYMKILLLSGFAYPLSALLINVLSSRGNSKAFLQLEVLKKSILIIPLASLLVFNIETYLYIFLVSNCLAILLNMAYVKNEIELKLFQLLKPLIFQSLICAVSIINTLYIIDFFEINSISANFLLKEFVFSIQFVFFNFLLKTESFTLVIDELKQVYLKKI